MKTIIFALIVIYMTYGYKLCPEGCYSPNGDICFKYYASQEQIGYLVYSTETCAGTTKAQLCRYYYILPKKLQYLNCEDEDLAAAPQWRLSSELTAVTYEQQEEIKQVESTQDMQQKQLQDLYDRVSESAKQSLEGFEEFQALKRRSCGKGNFWAAHDLKCKQCHHSCATCSKSSKNCKKCAKPNGVNLYSLVSHGNKGEKRCELQDYQQELNVKFCSNEEELEMYFDSEDLECKSLVQTEEQEENLTEEKLGETIITEEEEVVTEEDEEEVKEQEEEFKQDYSYSAIGVSGGVVGLLGGAYALLKKKKTEKERRLMVLSNKKEIRANLISSHQL